MRFHRSPGWPSDTLAFACCPLWAPTLLSRLVELSRQIKFVIVFLFAVNWLDSKSAVEYLRLSG